MLRHSRQKEMEEKYIEDEVARRVEELVAKRVEEELMRRKDEIDREVLRRVEEAKVQLEKQMLEEFERQRQEEIESQRQKEVKLISLLICIYITSCLDLLITICFQVFKCRTLFTNAMNLILNKNVKSGFVSHFSKRHHNLTIYARHV